MEDLTCRARYVFLQECSMSAWSKACEHKIKHVSSFQIRIPTQKLWDKSKKKLLAIGQFFFNVFLRPYIGTLTMRRCRKKGSKGIITHNGKIYIILVVSCNIVQRSKLIQLLVRDKQPLSESIFILTGSIKSSLIGTKISLT